MSDLIKEQRAYLRSKIREKRENLDKNELDLSSEAIFTKIVNHHFLKKRRVIGSYSSFKNEIDMHCINSYLKSQGHSLLLPTINFNRKGHMDFFSFNDFNSLITNIYGIKEPKPSFDNKCDAALIDVLLVPMLAFDVKGNRLGMGGGFYDRILKRVSSDCLIIGIAHEFQKLEYIPVQSWDMPLDEVITEKEHYIFIKKYSVL